MRLMKSMSVVVILMLTALMYNCNMDTKKHDFKNDAYNLEVGDLKTIFKMPFAYDHSIIWCETNKKWHLYGIIDPTHVFIHLTADSLNQENWERQEDFTYNGRAIWAPHIIEHENLYYMFFTAINEPREIRLAISSDCHKWKFVDQPLIAWKNEHTENMKAKDPMIFYNEDKEQWIMYVSMMKDDKHWVVGYATSKDLYKWSEPNICFDENTEEPGVESAFVVKKDGLYYLFLSARPWPNGAEEVFVSDTPYYFDAKNIVKSWNPWHAAEVIQDHDGQWYLTRSSGTEQDFRIAPLHWNKKDNNISDKK